MDLFDRLSALVDELTDEEIAEEFREEGTDAATVAAEVRKRILDAVEEYEASHPDPTTRALQAVDDSTKPTEAPASQPEERER